MADRAHVNTYTFVDVVIEAIAVLDHKQVTFKTGSLFKNEPMSKFLNQYFFSVFVSPAQRERDIGVTFSGVVVVVNNYVVHTITFYIFKLGSPNSYQWYIS